MVWWQPLHLGHRIYAYALLGRIALWSHQSVQAANNERCIVQIVNIPLCSPPNPRACSNCLASGQNIQRITMCPHGYHHNDFMVTPALGTQDDIIIEIRNSKILWKYICILLVPRHTICFTVAYYNTLICIIHLNECIIMQNESNGKNWEG